MAGTVPFGLNHNNYSLGTRYTFLGTNTQGGPTGILRPGQSETITFWAYSGTEAGSYSAFVDRNGKDPAAAFDWNSLRPSLLPSGMTDVEFEPIFQRMIADVRATWGDYLEMLGEYSSMIVWAESKPSLDGIHQTAFKRSTGKAETSHTVLVDTAQKNVHASITLES